MRQYRTSNKIEEFIETVKDDSFWDDCRRLIAKLKLSSKMVGDTESNSTPLSQVYIYFQELLQADVYSEDEIWKIKARWNFIHTESMGFAYILNPKTKGGLGMVGTNLKDTYVQLQKYLTKENEDNNDILEVFEDFTRYVARPSPNLEAVFNNKSFNP